MKRRLLSLVYLVGDKEKLVVNTKTAHTVTNKIPCEYEYFFKPSSAELYVHRELSEYPETMRQKEFRA